MMSGLKKSIKRLVSPMLLARLSRAFGGNVIRLGRGNSVEWGDAILRHCRVEVHGQGNKIIMGG